MTDFNTDLNHLYALADQLCACTLLQPERLAPYSCDPPIYEDMVFWFGDPTMDNL